MLQRIDQNPPVTGNRRQGIEKGRKTNANENIIDCECKKKKKLEL